MCTKGSAFKCGVRFHVNHGEIYSVDRPSFLFIDICNSIILIIIHILLQYIFYFVLFCFCLQVRNTSYFALVHPFSPHSHTRCCTYLPNKITQNIYISFGTEFCLFIINRKVGPMCKQLKFDYIYRRILYAHFPPSSPTLYQLVVGIA